MSSLLFTAASCASHISRLQPSSIILKKDTETCSNWNQFQCSPENMLRVHLERDWRRCTLQPLPCWQGSRDQTRRVFHVLHSQPAELLGSGNVSSGVCEGERRGPPVIAQISALRCIARLQQAPSLIFKLLRTAYEHASKSWADLHECSFASHFLLWCVRESERAPPLLHRSLPAVVRGEEKKHFKCHNFPFCHRIR